MTAQGASDGRLLYTPSRESVERAALTRYRRWLAATHGLDFDTYGDLWRWSVTDLEGFWASLWDFFGVRAHRPYRRILSRREMPGAEWFPGAELNYVEQVFRWSADRPAVMFRSEHRQPEDLTYGELFRRTSAVAQGLRELGVGRGDRVVAYAPNIPETLVMFLAAASLGAIWSACSPDFGATAVLDRFRQIEPKVLLAVDGYQFKGVAHDRRSVVAELVANLPSLRAVVGVANLGDERPNGSLAFDELGESAADLPVTPVPFEHPLWVLSSSGTTGLPKAIVHGHGGILLEHLKKLALHMDVGPDDRFFWHTSTGWMMWNVLVGGLLVGACVVLYDGSPAHPDLGALWRLAGDTGITAFGVSAPYLQACLKAGVVPKQEADLSRLRLVGSTGAPLPAEGFEWVYERVKPDVLVASVSGGTDVCTAFVGSCPVLPVHAGEIQCRLLGAKVEAFDEQGRPVVDQVGELVVTEPMPSMPLGLWNDEAGERYRSSYFETFPGVWQHGDWIRITERGSCVISGRSDATLNRGGVRIGTSELYRVVESLPEVVDSLVVDTGRVWLFVVPEAGFAVDDDLRSRIRERLRTELSPRHVPDEIREIGAVPRTLNGKKLEVPVKRVLLGERWEAVVSRDAIANPDAIDAFLELARLPELSQPPP